MSTYTTVDSNAVLPNKFDTLFLVQADRHIYGSSRLGVNPSDNSMDGGPVSSQYYEYGQFSRGWRQYELTNHLGNVLTTVSDRKIGVYSNGSLTLPNDSVLAVVDYYEPFMVSATDYYPFGMVSRQISAGAAGLTDYRYGFNGKENDNEVKGFGNQQDYGMRIYDNRLGRFLSVDPLQKTYPELTPYQFASNSPISGIDLDGLEHQWYLYQWHPNTGLTFVKKVTQTHQADWNDNLGVLFKDLRNPGHTYKNMMEGSVEHEGKLIKGESKTIIVEYYNNQENFLFEKSFNWHEELFKAKHDQIVVEEQPGAVDGRMLAMVAEQGWQESLFNSVKADVSFARAANFAADDIGLTYNPGVFRTPTNFVTNQQAKAVNSGSPEAAVANSNANLTFTFEGQTYSVNATTPYARPNNATTVAQRVAVNQPGAKCVTCGTSTGPFNADHKTPLAIEHLTTGTINKTTMRSVKAVQSQCATCSDNQGWTLRNAIRFVQQILKNGQSGQTPKK